MKSKYNKEFDISKKKLGKHYMNKTVLRQDKKILEFH